MHFTIQHRKLCHWLWSDGNRNKSNINKLMDRIKEENDFNDGFLKIIENNLKSNFLNNYFLYWKATSRIRTNFEHKHGIFLANFFEVSVPDSDVNARINHGVNKGGRPRSLANQASEKTKRRRIEELKAELRVWGGCSNDINLDPNGEGDDGSKECDSDHLADKALAMYLDLKLSQEDYENLRYHNEQSRNDKVYPPHKHVHAAKESCYPPGIEITESGARVPVQALMDHTTLRLLSTIPREKLNQFRGNILTFHSKWGMDGMKTEQVAKQVLDREDRALFEVSSGDDDDDEPYDGGSVFQVAMVPLRIEDSDSNILWENDRPSSVRYTRPIEFQFSKETPKNTMETYEYYKKEIDNLVPCQFIPYLGQYSSVSYKGHCTMMDTKTCNTLTYQKSTQCCNICGARPSEMNHLDHIKTLPVERDFFQYGFHPLNCRIRFLEHVLHLGYTLDFAEYIAKDDNVVVKASKKAYIQKSIKKKLGLDVDVVKKGYGTTNDGNTSRRFLEATTVVSQVTGVDEELLRRYRVILEILNSGYKVNIEKFKVHTEETAKLYVDTYGYYPMPPSVHKALIHGWKIIESVDLLIGCLTEEALECNNEVWKQARQDHSRWCDRKSCDEDVMRYLLRTSDPYIASLCREREKKSIRLSEGAEQLVYSED